MTNSDPAQPFTRNAAIGTVPVDRVRRPMRGLFWRIFLWFWLAMLLLAGAVTTSVYLTEPDQLFPHWHYVPLQRIDQLAARSVSVYETRGAKALRDYLIGLPGDMKADPTASRPQFDHAYLFDTAGRELSGQTVPTDPREMIRRSTGSPDLQLERLMTELLMARYVLGGNGTGYVLLLSSPRTSLLLPTTPQGWLHVGAALVTSALVCYWLARNVVAPVRRLQEAARRLASGDLAARVGTAPALAGRRDEFSDLARDFDEMAARIEGLLTAQRRLIADISHELGSPLTRVNVALGLAFRKAGSEVRPELERIEHEAHRLNDLIRQLLLLSELENHTPNEPREPVDLRKLVDEIATDAEFEASHRRCRVRVTQNLIGSSGLKTTVRGIHYLLRSAVENIVRNAIRYTKEDSEVLIELDSRPSNEKGQTTALVRVRDHGPGVPPTALDHLFRPFYRVSEARDRLSGGTGLGLAITQQAVEMHGGKVSAKNHPDGGLLVEVELIA